MGAYNDKEGSANCSLCEAGRYSIGGASGCLTCTYGTYSSGSGFWYCNECDNGRFTGDGSSTVRLFLPAFACFPCSDVFCSQCTACFAGTWGIGRLATDENCSGCGTGQYSTALGASSYAVCQACAAGKFSNETRAGQVRRVFPCFFHSSRVVSLRDPAVLGSPPLHVLCFSATHSTPS